MASSSKSMKTLRRKDSGFESPHETEAVVHILIVEVGNKSKKREVVYLFLFSRQFLSPPETKAGQATLIAEPVSGRRKGKLEQYIARSGATLIDD